MAAFAATMATSWAPSQTTARVVSSRVSSCGVNSVSSVSVAMRSSLRRNSFAAVRASSDAATASPLSVAPAISLTEKALSHLSKLRASQNKELCLRVGVRQGGCSGMSYVMDFEESSNLRPDDSVIDYEGFKMGTGGALVQLSAMSRVGVVRFMGFGTFNEEHKNAEVPHDESEDEADDDEHTEVVFEKASHEQFRQSNSVSKLRMLDFPLIVLKSARTNYSKTL